MRTFQRDNQRLQAAVPAPYLNLPQRMDEHTGINYDHIGILPAVAGDSIANGADDDASGTTAVVALAEHFKKVKNNARTLIFVAFTVASALPVEVATEPPAADATANIDEVSPQYKYSKHLYII